MSDFGKVDKITHPTQKVTKGSRIFVVDSRQRDCRLYPSPSSYRIALGEIYKNVTSIELKGSILPKTSYNVHSSNNRIDFSIGDTITNINVLESGFGYTAPPQVTISGPTAGGTQAVANSIIDGSGRVTAINITNPGTGYRRSKPPFVSLSPPPQGGLQASAEGVVGVLYGATLREGNYTIGGNPNPPTTVVPSKLVLEVQNALNYAVNGGNYDSASTSPFEVRLVSQYPELGAATGSAESVDTNACLYNRIQIINTDSDHWELLWCSGRHSDISARRLLGFNWVDQYDPITTGAVSNGSGDIISAGTSIRGLYDYDMTDDPPYCVLSFWASSEDSFERIRSLEGNGINRSFALMVYDANVPDNLLGLTGETNTLVGGTSYLEGETKKDTFFMPQGISKPLKGFDFDKKYLEFNPPIGKLSFLNIKFTKFGTKNGGQPNLYDFQGRDHLLIFQIESNDQMSGQRWG